MEKCIPTKHVGIKYHKNHLTKFHIRLQVNLFPRKVEISYITRYGKNDIKIPVIF